VASFVVDMRVLAFKTVSQATSAVGPTIKAKKNIVKLTMIYCLEAQEMAIESCHKVPIKLLNIRIFECIDGKRSWPTTTQSNKIYIK